MTPGSTVIYYLENVEHS